MGAEPSAARATWRLHKARLLIELEHQARACADGHLFELRMAISQGVPICQIVSGVEILVQGALV